MAKQGTWFDSKLGIALCILVLAVIIMLLLRTFKVIEFFDFISLPDFGSTRNYLPSIEDALKAGGAEGLPEYTAMDPSMEHMATLNPNLSGLVGKVIGRVVKTAVIAPPEQGASSFVTTLLASDQESKTITELFIAALNDANPPSTSLIANSAPNWKLLTQGSTTLKTDISVTSGLVKTYTLDLFAYNKTSNFVSHMNAIIVSDENKGTITILAIEFPDVTVAQQFRPIPSELMSSSVNGSSLPSSSSLAMDMASFNRLASTAELPPIPPSSSMPPAGFTGFPAMCFGTMDVTAATQTECSTFGGIWDSPVTSDAECPYFQANKNYDNIFGGANIGGYCQLPSGMQLTGYRHGSTSESSVPLCYNCHGIRSEINGSTLGPCCSEQENNRKLYPTLKSPDYAFPGDQAARIAGAPQLSALGLSVR